jgi:hypothetical protein
MSCCIKEVIYGSNLTEIIYKDKEKIFKYCADVIELISFQEPLNNAYVKVFGEIWFNQETGGYFKSGGISFATPIEGTDALGQPRGGGYFNR